MFEKPKNDSRSARRNILFFLALGLMAVIGGMIGFFLKSEAVPSFPPSPMDPSLPVVAIGDETILVPLQREQPTLTHYAYSGVITMLIQGAGKMSGAQFSDAFYTYMDANGRDLMPPLMDYSFTLEIDGENAYNRLALNSEVLPYSPLHTYLVRYDVGPQPHAVSLRTSDLGVSDNSGAFQVTFLRRTSWLQTLTSFAPTPTPEPLFPREGGEVFVVPFTSGSPVYTQNLYSGTVKLILRGTGQAGGIDYSDAFYLYERGDHNPYVPPVLGDFAMELDGRKIHEVLNLKPDYSPDHVYTVMYNLGSQPRRIGFRNTDLSVGDNQGAYTVEVVAGS